MPIPTTGELRFSAIGTEFQDTHPIQLSHYFKNITTIDTSHINTENYPNSPFPDTFNEFRLSLFRGKEKNIVFVEPSPTNQISTITDWKAIANFANDSAVEWLNGVIIINNRLKEHETEILEIDDSNRGKVNTRDDRRSLRIHARTTDILRITGYIGVSDHYGDPRRISVYYKGVNTPWIHVGTSGLQMGVATHNVTFNIPYLNLTVGIYAIEIIGYYNDDTNYGSTKKYTLEIW